VFLGKNGVHTEAVPARACHQLGARVTYTHEQTVAEESVRVFRTDTFVRIPMGSFEDVYRRHVQAVFRFALSVVGRKELAEDLTAEAFLALWRNFDGIDQEKLPGWLIAVVRNRAHDWWRRQQVEQRHAESEMQSTRTTAPPLEDWFLDSPDLKPVHRTCLMLRYVHGLSRSEIASQLALSETQVKGHLQYALALLRKTYGKTIVV
jgi:RNA polymerase sigma-70 factor (ECF subfamily)